MLLNNQSTLSVSSSMLRSSTNARANVVAATIELGLTSEDEDDSDRAPQQPSNLRRKLFHAPIGERTC